MSSLRQHQKGCKCFTTVTEFYGKTIPILVVRSDYILSTDNTIKFLFEERGVHQSRRQALDQITIITIAKICLV